MHEIERKHNLAKFKANKNWKMTKILSYSKSRIEDYLKWSQQSEYDISLFVIRLCKSVHVEVEIMVDNAGFCEV